MQPINIKQVTEAFYLDGCQLSEISHQHYSNPPTATKVLPTHRDEDALGMSIESTGRRIRLAHISRSNQIIRKQVYRLSSTLEFFDQLAFCVAEFINTLEDVPEAMMGITMGQVEGLENIDVQRAMNDALLCRHLPVRVEAVNNPVISALMTISENTEEDEGIVAACFENGMEVAYLQHTLGRRISIDDEAVSLGEHQQEGRLVVSHMINELSSVPLTMWDRRLDRESECPGAKGMEKLVGEQYVGEMVRNLITDFMDTRELFRGVVEVEKLNTPGMFHTGYMSAILSDNSNDLRSVEDLFAAEFGIQSIPLEDRQLIRRLCEVVAQRAAKVMAGVLAGTCWRTKRDRCEVRVRGGWLENNLWVYEKMTETLGELMKGRVRVEFQQDGLDLIGAAL